ncbi:cobyric acid synthase [Oxyplasma meridianum]|uniref:Probable cobyric acid synthase n=1 Tax=Oxyplasma meridianum TaxID=3073602 RepID=A0AAX4NDH5_9ARCH
MKDPVTGKSVIQVLGTSSNAGKSTVTLAICRFLSRKGYRVAPFKSMNMSLNSVAIEGGYEIPRSQWLQAFAASTPPLKEMSAILLKPEGKNGSQVIVNGKSMGVMSIDEYYRYLVGNGKKVVKDSLDFLCDRFDVVVAEGAGSPAEINLMDRDVANIYVSTIYNTPAILVGDIERGGVFASLFGTMEIMPRSDLVKGMVINKMRGSKSLLNDGIEKIERMTGIPVLGILPYVDGVFLPGEDSQDYDCNKLENRKICLIRYPKMENYSDTDPFIIYGLGYHNVSASNINDLDIAETIILPGSKNVESDLKYIIDSGIVEKLNFARKRGVTIVGICGGYQMLGKIISDPEKNQIRSGRIEGLGFLDLTTEYSREKIVDSVEYYLEYWGIPGSPKGKGYEIHYGTVFSNEKLHLLNIGGRREGAVSPDGKIIGTNVHGIFENRDFIHYITGEKVPDVNYSEELMRRVDIITNSFIENMDMSYIERLVK